jgi:hypothetical protein
MSKNVLAGPSINPSYFNQVSSAIFNNMSGIRNDATGSYENAAFGFTLSPANSLHPTPTSPNDFSTVFTNDPSPGPAPYLLRLYNAPRIVLSDVHQDTAGDGSYATQLYRYNPYPSYPYGSGVSPYPGPAGQSSLSSSSAPIRITLQFSEPMDTATPGSGGIFSVQLRFSDGSTQDVSGSWSTTYQYTPNDTWTGTASFSGGFPQGLITVVVRARRALCGSHLDTSVQELDTTGSGQSGASPSNDTSTTFTINTNQPDSEIGGNQGPSASIPIPSTYCVTLWGSDPVGIQSIVLSSNAVTISSASFSCVSPSTSAFIGPTCGLSGAYDETITGCEQLTRHGTVNITTTTADSMVLCGNGTCNTANPDLSLSAQAVMTLSAPQNLGISTTTTCSQLNFSVVGWTDGGCSGDGANITHTFTSNQVKDAPFTITNSTNSAYITNNSVNVGYSVFMTNIGQYVGPNSVGFLHNETFSPGNTRTGYGQVAQWSKQRFQRSVSTGTTVVTSSAPVSFVNIDCTGTVPVLPFYSAVQRLVPILAQCRLLGSDFQLNEPALLNYSAPSPAGVAVDTSTLALYRFNGIAWSSATVTGQRITVAGGVVTASGTYTLSGTYGLFFNSHDSSAPVTTAGFAGSTSSFLGSTIVSTSAFIVLTASDPIVNGYAAGVSTTFYRMDATSAAASYSIYSSSVPLALGFHALDYYSEDYSGNIENVHTSTFLVTAGTLLTTTDLRTAGDLLAGFLSYGPHADIQSRAENAFTLAVSSADRSPEIITTNVGQTMLGGWSPQANLEVVSGQSEVPVELRSGNASTATPSVQIAFGYNGDVSMSHSLRSEHNSAAVDNSLDFLVWYPPTGSTTTLGNLEGLALQELTASGGSFHVHPATGVATAQVEVSDGGTIGAGVVHRAAAYCVSSRAIKTDIAYLKEKAQKRAYEDVLALQPAAFRYKRDAPGTVRRGLIFEEAPESIRAPGNRISYDERLVNVELALKEASARLEKLRQRLHDLEAGK